MKKEIMKRQALTPLFYKKTIRGLGFLMLVSLISACSAANKARGGSKNAPDEFLILSKPPLIVPPEYNLRPVKPGTQRPEDLITKQNKQASLLLEIDPAQPSDAEALLLARANAGSADPMIKLLLDAEAGVDEKSKSLTEDLLKGKVNPEQVQKDKTLGEGEIKIKRKQKVKLPGL